MKFLQEQLDAEIGHFVFPVSTHDSSSLFCSILQVATHFQMDFVDGTTVLLNLFPQIMDHTQRLEHDLFHDGIAQGILLELPGELLQIGWGFPTHDL